MSCDGVMAACKVMKRHCLGETIRCCAVFKSVTIISLVLAVVVSVVC